MNTATNAQKGDNMKWYANYNSVEKEHILISEKRREELMQQCKEESDFHSFDIFNSLQVFNTFSEAKKWCLDGYRCDLSIIKINLANLRKQRAK